MRHSTKCFITWLIRHNLHLKDRQLFRFTNQNKPDAYFFMGHVLWKYDNWDTDYRPHMTTSGVSLNWLLDDDCGVVLISDEEFKERDERWKRRNNGW